MADKEYNINLPDGTQLQIPAWAKESTLFDVSIELQQMAKVDENLLKIVAEYSGDSKQIIQEVINNSKGGAANEQQETATKKNLTKQTKKFGRQVLDTARFLGDSKTPITSMVNAIREGGKPVMKLAGHVLGPLGKAFADFENGGLTAAGRAVGKHSDVITDAAFMLAGWNAGKLESFAAVQQQMIDNGAIMFESGSAFNELRVAVNSSGVTYDAFAKTIAANNSAITVFGGNVSVGTRRFQKFFSDLELSADNLGDFGLSNTELLQQTGEFLEYQRLTGGLIRNTADLEEKLTTSFTQLQLETAGLASITGLSRSQAMQAITQIQNVDYAIGIRKLEGEQKEAAEEARQIFAQLELVAGTDSPISTLSNALANSLAYAQGDLDKLNIEASMAGQSEDLAVIRRQFGDDFINELQTSIQTGDIANVRDTIMKAMQTDLSYLGTQSAANTDALAGRAKSLAGAMMEIQQAGLDKATTDRLDAAVAKQAEALAEAGTSTKLMNDATKAFFKLQELVTADMDWLAGSMEKAADAINRGVQYITGGNDGRTAGVNAERATIQDMQDMATAERDQWEGYVEGTRETQQFFDDNNQGSQWDEYGRAIDEEGNLIRKMYFGGQVNAGGTYLVGDSEGSDPNKNPNVEMFHAPVDGRILSNRELKEVINSNLTQDNSSSILVNNLENEYKLILETKQETLQTLKNLKKFTKNKILTDRLNNARDASGA